MAEWAELETASFRIARAARSPALDPARRAAARARDLMAAARAGDRSLPARALRRGLRTLRPPSTAAEQPGDALPLPDEDLIWRVTGARSAEWFNTSGQTSRREIEQALAIAGVRLADSGRALEFGCGCGRILRWMRDVGERAELHGVDIDGEAIAWAREHLPWAHVAQNTGLPPLDFPAEHFDVVFNHSVFTHLDVHYQDAWLEELRRVTRPGGVLLLTVTGQQAFEEVVAYYRETGQDHAALSEAYRTKGILFIEDDMWKDGPFPDFYHSTFHAPWYVFEHWGSYFTIEAYLVRASLDLQDQVILRRR
jgi:SAM-dependent methyltransferase